MCGIVGFTWTDEALATRMSDAIAHRGPDQYGTYSDDSISLGSRRLSIIDLSENGRMPLTNEDSSIWITYNGEVYNFPQIREELHSRGHTFRSNTDTEVIVHAYEEYGPDCVKRFNGMFAIAVWDRNKQELFLARDRFGIKPLYYYLKNGRLVFGSELKAILEDPSVEREINPQSLYYYMGYEWVPMPDTIFRNIYKLPPAHYLRYRDGRIELTQYWDVQARTDSQSREYYEQQLRELLTESVRKRLISDVPLGVFLSGGLDSSTIVALMSKCGVDPIQTFSLGYEDPTFSELEYANVVARQFNTQHQVLMIDTVTPELVEEAVWHLDEPMSELSTIPFYLICKKAREHVTVCLSGEGGDEVLVGYDRFRASKANAYYSILPRFIRHGIIAPLVNSLPDQPQKKGAVNMLKRFIEGGLLPEDGEHMRWQYFGSAKNDQRLFSRELLAEIELDPFAPVRDILSRCNSSDRLDREIYLDLKLAMPEIALMKADRMSMAHGLEVRVPFLDHEFVEFCATIPGNMKLEGFNTKSIFKTAMKGILPDVILNRGKQGFSVPIKNWLRNEMRDYMQDVLTSSPLIGVGFNADYIQRLVREHLEYQANHSHVLWALVNLGIWHKMFVEYPARSNGARAGSGDQRATKSVRV